MTTPSPAAKAQQFAANLSLWVGVFVFGIKLGGYAFTHSVGILSDALESTVNVAAAILLGFSVRIAQRPADHNHPYGHNKVEYVTSFIEGLLIGIAGLLIIQTSIDRLMHPVTIHLDAIGLGLTIFASVLNGALGWYLVDVGKRYRSIALSADGKHVLSDVVTSAAVLLGVGIAFFTGWTWLDPVIGLLVAGGILSLGWNIIRQSMAGLMDESISAAEHVLIVQAIERFRDQMIEYHDLRTRQSGHQIFIDFHLILHANISLRQAHTLCDHIEDAISEALPMCNITIHVEPEDCAEHTDHLKIVVT